MEDNKVGIVGYWYATNYGSVVTYLLAEYEQWLYKRLKEFAITQIDKEAEIETLKKRIGRDKYDINEKLKSRAFKIGRGLTRKSERMDLLKFEEIFL